jgi:hypothetical protein
MRVATVALGLFCIATFFTASGCGSSTRNRRLSASVFHAARMVAKDPPPPPQPPAEIADEGAGLVYRALKRAGLRFGTDGSTGALWGYMRTAHTLIDPADARPGDVLFFDRGGRQGEPRRCADHAAVVARRNDDGRISFLEARGGRVRKSVLHPALPLVRRDDRGRVVNSFLRAKQPDDPPDGRYFAGEMLCAVARVTPVK